ncbi:polysaccharide deacetylase family protein [Clostridium sp.]|uniref:polysaccharide deacetylase family protein n=1 Tax=Clostridium sp. TaxID=1506 RepID=UPI002A8ACA5F|nr:polysaccharide deacetylase family protein [Clostridium sp.]
MKRSRFFIFFAIIILFFSYGVIAKAKENKSILCINNYNRQVWDEGVTDKTYRIVPEKVVYLTFDDGPSVNNTSRILDILKEQGVKATFFVVGTRVESHPDIVRRMYTDNMSIAPHCNNHDYKMVYASKDSFFNDYYSCMTSIERVTKEKVKNFVRMPGGSTNTICKSDIMKDIKGELKEKNIYYIDWNVSSGDASSYRVPKDKIEENIMAYSKGWDTIVVLMHDAEAKTTTVDALPDIIKYFKDNGYSFRTLDDMSKIELNKMIKFGIVNK